ncbi:Glycosyl transferase [Anatilimnocola aggregata]|uniref:Lipid-A-disaccharide synthase n=1 Tax=Anatilimnocola aggregata TaxID=2528021 RepID=A0A517YI84_9BACT|nr:lipid-A-disaccharide synthase [Anatilimnocola aggregata]QDU29921.1 Glycosyl transferase [Anatilimnocola aggregata]
MKLFFSVGEPSGDLHGANLIRQLEHKAGKVETLGLGGPRMRAAGCHLLRDMTDLAIMGLVPALAKLPQFLKLLAQVEQSLKTERPDAVVLIDYPGFNWHVAKKAKALGIPVVYYGLPQLWAWLSWRVEKVRKYIDHPLCKLPFEEAWFRAQGCPKTTYVGHPYFDELKTQKLDEQFLAQFKQGSQRLVTILPGSRRSEVTKNFASQVRAAELIHRAVPDVRFAVASYNQQQAAMAMKILGQTRLPLTIIPGKTAELIHAATCTLAVSGSVSLELLYHAKPTVVQYTLPMLTYYAMKALVRVNYMSLVNLLTTDELHPRNKLKYDRHSPQHAKALFPEYPDWRDRSADVASHAIEWLQDEPGRLALVRKLEDLRSTLAIGGASANAADYILNNVVKIQQTYTRAA